MTRMKLADQHKIVCMILHTLALLVMSGLFLHQCNVVHHMGDNNLLHEPYLLGLAVFYCLILLHKAKLTKFIDPVGGEKLFHYIHFTIIVFAIVLYFLDGKNDLSVIIKCLFILTEVILPEGIIKLIYSFKPR